jgi:molybdopterin converting factor small subunit
MAVNVHLHATHRQFTQGSEVVAVEGRTVGECLNHLIKQFPGMEKALFAKKDKLLNTVEVYVNHASAYPNELAKPVKDGDEIHLIMLLAIVIVNRRCGGEKRPLGLLTGILLFGYFSMRFIIEFFNHIQQNLQLKNNLENFYDKSIEH